MPSTGFCWTFLAGILNCLSPSYGEFTVDCRRRFESVLAVAVRSGELERWLAGER